jgi:hypothetical protein
VKLRLLLLPKVDKISQVGTLTHDKFVEYDIIVATWDKKRLNIITLPGTDIATL